MSHVTNIMVAGLFDKEEDVIVKSQLQKFTDYSEVAPFDLIDNCKVGGNKCIEGDLFIAAFNYMEYRKFIETMKEFKNLLKDYTYDDMQVFIKNQDHDKWYVYSIDELDIKCF